MSFEWRSPYFNPDYYDPALDKSRHPQLPCGWNSAAVNQDEFNGAGYNEPCWTNTWDSFVGLTPLLLTTEKMATFSECPDVTIRAEDNTITLRREVRVQTIRSW